MKKVLRVFYIIVTENYRYLVLRSFFFLKIHSWINVYHLYFVTDDAGINNTDHVDFCNADANDDI